MDDDDSINEYYNQDIPQHTTHLLDEEVLGQIKLNDPAITSLAVSWYEETGYAQSVNWTVERKAIGYNTQLKRLSLSGLGDNTRSKSFCIGLSDNQSIEDFIICDSELPLVIADESIMATLYPFFAHNNNLKSIEFDECSIGDDNTRMLAFSLEKRGNKSTLRKITFWDCSLGGEKVVGELMTALEAYDNLKELSLIECEFGGKGGFVSLDLLLQKPNCSLEKLYISHNDLDNECCNILAKVLTRNRSLKVLDLSSCVFDEQGMRSLSNSLVNNNTLKQLICKCSSIGSAGLTLLSSRLPYMISSLKVLDLSGCSIDDRGAATLGSALQSSVTAVKALELNLSLSSISASGWDDFCVCLRDTNSSLKRLSIANCGINEEKITVLSNALLNNSTLKTLNISHNNLDSQRINVYGLMHRRSIGADPWQSFSSVLRHPNSGLEEIDMCGCGLTDEDVIGFANDLANNTSLRSLVLSGNGLTRRSWDVFSLFLFNKTSIQATYESNHTLCSLSTPGDSNRTLPDHLVSSLQTNGLGTGVARQKILWQYFLSGGDSINVKQFLDMDMNVLPQAMSWTGREDDGHSLMFTLLQSMPCLFESTSSGQVKRRRDF